MHDKFMDWARAEERRGVEIPAIAYRQDGKRLGVLMSDLSYDGCQLKVHDNIAADEEITLVIFELGAEVLATVKWVRDETLGVRFGEMSKAAEAT
ncbi:PilZ domain-containing protein [Sphingomonas glaciei]|uniref:PilZ domain-containing protein n=1 Tax=Sphingomonas glaciei TaxID=2938948 RepID=A0ABY5MZ92_9SPHN|nr:PilZ domain-containing protein [Sphingomonas glaciei]UUR09351.1 PilZ domain-containing protein [Sphingomonas glaciei]